MESQPKRGGVAKSRGPGKAVGSPLKKRTQQKSTKPTKQAAKSSPKKKVPKKENVNDKEIESSASGQNSDGVTSKPIEEDSPVLSQSSTASSEEKSISKNKPAKPKTSRKKPVETSSVASSDGKALDKDKPKTAKTSQKKPKEKKETAKSQVPKRKPAISSQKKKKTTKETEPIEISDDVNDFIAQLILLVSDDEEESSSQNQSATNIDGHSLGKVKLELDDLSVDKIKNEPDDQPESQSSVEVSDASMAFESSESLQHVEENLDTKVACDVQAEDSADHQTLNSLTEINISAQKTPTSDSMEISLEIQPMKEDAIIYDTAEKTDQETGAQDFIDEAQTDITDNTCVIPEIKSSEERTHNKEAKENAIDNMPREDSTIIGVCTSEIGNTQDTISDQKATEDLTLKPKTLSENGHFKESTSDSVAEDNSTSKPVSILENENSKECIPDPLAEKDPTLKTVCHLENENHQEDISDSLTEENTALTQVCFKEKENVADNVSKSIGEAFLTSDQQTNKVTEASLDHQHLYPLVNNNTVDSDNMRGNVSNVGSRKCSIEKEVSVKLNDPVEGNLNTEKNELTSDAKVKEKKKPTKPDLTFDKKTEGKENSKEMDVTSDDMVKEKKNFEEIDLTLDENIEEKGKPGDVDIVLDEEEKEKPVEMDIVSDEEEKEKPEEIDLTLDDTEEINQNPEKDSTPQEKVQGPVGQTVQSAETLTAEISQSLSKPSCSANLKASEDKTWASRLPPPPGCDEDIILEDYYESEFRIDVLPKYIRNYLVLKGINQGEIKQFSGASVSLKKQMQSDGGACSTPVEVLLMKGKTRYSILMADRLVKRLISEAEEINSAAQRIFSCKPTEPVVPPAQPTLSTPVPPMNPVNPPLAVATPPQVETAAKPASKWLPEKVFVGLDEAPASFNVRSRLLGSLQQFKTLYGVDVRLNGSPSPAPGGEALHLLVSPHNNEGNFRAAVDMAHNLVQKVNQEFFELWTKNKLQSLASAPPKRATQPVPMVANIHGASPVSSIPVPPAAVRTPTAKPPPSNMPTDTRQQMYIPLAKPASLPPNPSTSAATAKPPPSNMPTNTQQQMYIPLAKPASLPPNPPTSAVIAKPPVLKRHTEATQPKPTPPPLGYRPNPHIVQTIQSQLKPTQPLPTQAAKFVPRAVQGAPGARVAQPANPVIASTTVATTNTSEVTVKKNPLVTKIQFMIGTKKKLLKNVLNQEASPSTPSEKEAEVSENVQPVKDLKKEEDSGLVPKQNLEPENIQPAFNLEKDKDSVVKSSSSKELLSSPTSSSSEEEVSRKQKSKFRIRKSNSKERPKKNRDGSSPKRSRSRSKDRQVRARDRDFRFTNKGTRNYRVRRSRSREDRSRSRERIRTSDNNKMKSRALNKRSRSRSRGRRSRSRDRRSRSRDRRSRSRDRRSRSRDRRRSRSRDIVVTRERDTNTRRLEENLENRSRSRDRQARMRERGARERKSRSKERKFKSKKKSKKTKPDLSNKWLEMEHMNESDSSVYSASNKEEEEKTPMGEEMGTDEDIYQRLLTELFNYVESLHLAIKDQFNQMPPGANRERLSKVLQLFTMLSSFPTVLERRRRLPAVLQLVEKIFKCDPDLYILMPHLQDVQKIVSDLPPELEVSKPQTSQDTETSSNRETVGPPRTRSCESEEVGIEPSTLQEEISPDHLKRSIEALTHKPESSKVQKDSATPSSAGTEQIQSKPVEIKKPRLTLSAVVMQLHEEVLQYVDTLPEGLKKVQLQQIISMLETAPLALVLNDNQKTELKAILLLLHASLKSEIASGEPKGLLEGMKLFDDILNNPASLKKPDSSNKISSEGNASQNVVMAQPPTPSIEKLPQTNSNEMVPKQAANNQSSSTLIASAEQKKSTLSVEKRPKKLPTIQNPQHSKVLEVIKLLYEALTGQIPNIPAGKSQSQLQHVTQMLKYSLDNQDGEVISDSDQIQLKLTMKLLETIVESPDMASTTLSLMKPIILEIQRFLDNLAAGASSAEQTAKNEQPTGSRKDKNSSTMISHPPENNPQTRQPPAIVDKALNHIESLVRPRDSEKKSSNRALRLPKNDDRFKNLQPITSSAPPEGQTKGQTKNILPDSPTEDQPNVKRIRQDNTVAVQPTQSTAEPADDFKTARVYHGNQLHNVKSVPNSSNVFSSLAYTFGKSVTSKTIEKASKDIKWKTVNFIRENSDLFFSRLTKIYDADFPNHGLTREMAFEQCCMYLLYLANSPDNHRWQDIFWCVSLVFDASITVLCESSAKNIDISRSSSGKENPVLFFKSKGGNILPVLSNVSVENPPPNSTSFLVATWNMKNLQNFVLTAENAGFVDEALESNNISVACLQSVWNGGCQGFETNKFVWMKQNSESNSHGVIMVVRKDLVSAKFKFNSHSNKVASVTFSHDGYKFTVIGCDFSGFQGNMKANFSTVAKILQELDTSQVMIVGDFNARIDQGYTNENGEMLIRFSELFKLKIETADMESNSSKDHFQDNHFSHILFKPNSAMPLPGLRLTNFSFHPPQFKTSVRACRIVFKNIKRHCFVTWFVDSLHSEQRRNQVEKQLLSTDTTLACIQFTGNPFTTQLTEDTRTQTEFSWYFPQKQQSNIAFVLRRDPNMSLTNLKYVTSKVATAEIKIGNFEFFIVGCVFSKALLTEETSTLLFTVNQSPPTARLVVMGDFEADIGFSDLTDSEREFIHSPGLRKVYSNPQGQFLKRLALLHDLYFVSTFSQESAEPMHHTSQILFQKANLLKGVKETELIRAERFRAKMLVYRFPLNLVGF